MLHIHMKKRCFYLFVVLSISLLLTFLIACSRPQPTPTPEPSPTPTIVPTLSPTPTPLPPELEFSSPVPDSQYSLGEDDSIIVNGTYKNLTPEESYVWLFLVDIFGGYYLQSPAIILLNDGTWEGTNIRPLEEIRYVVAIYVSPGGNQVLEGWVDDELFGQLDASRVKGVDGYQELARVKIITPGINVPPPVESNPTNSTGSSEVNLVLDDFSIRNESPVNCTPFGDEKAEPLLSYCVYSVNAQTLLDHVDLNDGNQALKVDYNLPSHPTPGWGNWVSIRREVDSLINLSGFSGVTLHLRVEQSANTLLRITLVDIEQGQEVGIKGGDELWWCNLENVMDNSTGEWQTITCPFEDFVQGAVGRNNDLMLDLERIIGYEFTIVSESGTNPNGIVELDSFTAYGDTQ